jgi:hypothetical protein
LICKNGLLVACSFWAFLILAILHRSFFLSKEKNKSREPRQKQKMSNPLLPSNTHTHESSDIPDFQVSVTNNDAVEDMTIHRSLTNNPHNVTAAELVPSLGNVPDVKQNLAGGGPPDPNINNASDGYTVGSRWITGNTEYVCTFSDMTTATWVIAHAGTTALPTGVANEQLALDADGVSLKLNTDNYIAASSASPTVTFGGTSTRCAVIASGGTNTDIEFDNTSHAAVISTTGPVYIGSTNAVVGACRNTEADPITISGSGRAKAILGCAGPQTISTTGDNNGIMFSSCNDTTTGHEISGVASNSGIISCSGDKVTITGNGAFSIGSTAATTISGTRCGQIASAGGGTLASTNTLVLASSGPVDSPATGAGRFVCACSGTTTLSAGSRCGAMFCSGDVTVAHNNAAVLCTSANLATTADNQIRTNDWLTDTGGMICDPAAKKWMNDVPDDPQFKDKFMAIQPIEFRYLTDEPIQPLRTGFSAQELQASFPHTVNDTFLRKEKCTLNEQTQEWVGDSVVYDAAYVTVDDPYGDPTKGTYKQILPADDKGIDSVGLVQLVWTACQKNTETIHALRQQLATLQGN